MRNPKQKLAPCPFCGGEAVQDTDDNVSSVACIKCDFGLVQMYSDTNGYALDIWNHRPLEQKLQSENDELKKQVELLGGELPVMPTNESGDQK